MIFTNYRDIDLIREYNDMRYLINGLTSEQLAGEHASEAVYFIQLQVEIKKRDLVIHNHV